MKYVIPVNDLCHVVTCDITNHIIVSLHCSLICAVVIYVAIMLIANVAAWQCSVPGRCQLHAD